MLSAMSRPLRRDEKMIPVFVGETTYNAVVLTDYAEIATRDGTVGGPAGSFIVDGPNGVEVLTAGEFGEKYDFGPEQDPVPDEEPAENGEGDEAPADESPADDEGEPEGDEAPVLAEESAEVDVTVTEPPAEVLEGADAVIDYEDLNDSELQILALDLEVDFDNDIAREDLIALINDKVEAEAG